MKYLLISVFSFITISSAFPNQQGSSLEIAETVPGIIQKYINEVYDIQSDISEMLPTFNDINVSAQDTDTFVVLEELLSDEVNGWLLALNNLKVTVTYLLAHVDSYKTKDKGIYIVPKERFDYIVKNLGTIVYTLQDFQNGFTYAMSMVQSIEKPNAKTTAELKATTAEVNAQAWKDIGTLGYASADLGGLLKVILAADVDGQNVKINLPLILDSLQKTLSTLPNFQVIAQQLIHAVEILQMWNTKK